VLTKADNDTLHGNRVNAIRNFPEGIVVWGTRTLSADPEWNYVNVQRLFIFLEQSIKNGTQWAAFEPNDVSLWKKLRRNISAFLRIQWLEGKLVGATEEQAFYVKCDAETNPPEIVDAGMVITEIGVAPSKPAEFVVFRIRQIAGGDSGS
jgi:phage tail sheath protein FI